MGDLIAIEAKYHFNCLSAFKSKYEVPKDPCVVVILVKKIVSLMSKHFVRSVSYIEEHILTGSFCIQVK